MLYSAMHPDRLSALVLVNTAARYLAADDYPIGVSESSLDALVETIAQTWGTTEFARLVNPSMSDDETYLRHMARTHRSSATPRGAAAQYEYLLRQDVRQVLPLIQVPTLVIHLSDFPLVPISLGRYLADRIRGATLVEIPGGDAPVISVEIADGIAEFVTGERPTAEPDRVLATVMFTDIVSSTEHVASLGDVRWRSLLDAHDKLVRDQLRLFGGKEIKTTGDGFLLTFDGPARAIRCARALCEASESIGIKIRVGLHTGECHVRDNDLSGLAVHIAARVGSLAAPSEVLVSGTVRDLVVGSDFEFTTRGRHSLKGVPGNWQLYALITT
jgi:class 3 adenylate cyclase